jgi:hypothetical protein
MSPLSDNDYLDSDKFLTECLTILEEKYKAGDKGAIALALYQCFIMNKPAPEWLRAAFIAAYESVTGLEVKSWAQAFGGQVFGAGPHPKKARLKQRMAHRDLRYPIARLVYQFSRRKTISRPMFDDIAEELKRTGVLEEAGLTDIGGGTVDDIFYKHGGKEIYESIKSLFEPIPRQ